MMASHHVSSLKPNEVSSNLRSGTFALKWPEETNKSTPIAVNLCVDSKGYYLICLNKVTKETECFDIALIHDTRTGPEAILPRGANECEQLNIGMLDVPLTHRWLSIYYGNTFVPDRDLRIIHFCFQYPRAAREWAEQLFQYGHNPLLRNLSSLECLEKFHSKIIHCLVEDRFDKKAIPVRSLIQFLCKNTRDPSKETKILKALEYLELPCRTEMVIDPEQLTFNKFFRFYMQLMERHEIDKLFDQTKAEIDVEEGLLAMIPGGKHRRYLNWEKIRDFIVKQNDARGGAFGLDYYDKKAKDLVKKYTQHDKQFLHKGMSDESFLRYLLSFDNFIVDPAKFDLFMDMDKPLTHYFISSSHNTYLTGSQLTGRASTEMYRQVLLTGCRCIELDVVESEKKLDEPEIKHRNTPVRSIPFVEVITAIRDSAFKISPYPVILSLENHCGPRAQARMAQYLIEILGEMLVSQPLKTHPCEEDCPLPSPNDLKRRILIKNKKLHQTETSKVTQTNGQSIFRKTDSIATVTSETSCPATFISTSPPTTIDGNRRKTASINEFETPLNLNENDENCSSSDDENCTTNINEVEVLTNSASNPEFPTNSDNMVESRATKAMSDLVHYVVPVRFVTFARSEERKRSYEMSSFSEDKAQNLIREHAREFVAYNQRQLSRIYPRGTRFDSSNYNPYQFWPVGCQMVALNYQTLDTSMQVNLALFSFNGNCGFIEKPASLCQSTGSFDPKVRTSVENVVGYQIEIKILSGQFLCQDREPTYVDVEMYGMYADATKRHEYRARAKRWNGFQAIYDETDVDSQEFSIRFSKVILPEMASLRFAVSEEDGTLIGQCLIPVAHLRPGYRHVVLRNSINIPINSSSLFVFIRKDVHVDEENRTLIDQLVSPTTKEFPQQIKTKVLSEQRSYSISDLNSMRKYSQPDISSTTLLNAPQYPSSNQINKIHHVKRRNQSTPFVDANWYHTQFIVSSQFNDRERLTRILSLQQLEQTKTFQREKEKIQTKLRRATSEYDKKILNEEQRFQHCLARQRTSMISNPLHHQWNNVEFHSTSQSIVEGRTTSFLHQKMLNEEIRQVETRLLDLYSTKFHCENELEYKYSKDYYNDLEKSVMNFYSKQLNQINEILKQEQSKVKEDVRVQMKLETKKTMMTETDREKILNLKEKIRQMNIEAGALAIRKLQEMHEQLEKTIRMNLQMTLNDLQRMRDSETKNRFNKYLNQFNEIKHRLSREISGEESIRQSDHMTTSSPYRSTITTSASLSALSHQPTTRPTSNSSRISPLTSPSEHEYLLLSSSQQNRSDSPTIDSDIESTRF